MHITQNIIRKLEKMVLYIYTLLLKNQINTPYDNALYYLYKINYVSIDFIENLMSNYKVCYNSYNWFRMNWIYKSIKIMLININFPYSNKKKKGLTVPIFI